MSLIIAPAAVGTRMAGAVKEFDVLLGTTRWLANRGSVKRMVISPPRGQGISQEEQKRKLKNELASVGFSDFSFSPNGPDISAWDSDCIWKVECKGLTGGARSTVNNNFDRALSSVVSYYDEPDLNENTGLRAALNSLSKPDRPVRLLLALPASPQYLDLLRKCVKQALRRKLDLWLLIFESETKSPQCYAPDSEI